MISKTAEQKQQYYDVYRSEGHITSLPSSLWLDGDHAADPPDPRLEKPRPGQFFYRVPADPAETTRPGFYERWASSAEQAAVAFNQAYPVVVFYAGLASLQVYTPAGGWCYVADIEPEMGGTRRITR